MAGDDITWDDVVAMPGASGLSGVALAAQTTILAYVNTTLDYHFFGKDTSSPKYKLARIYLAIHLGLTSATSVGIIGSQTEGGLSQTYILPPIPAATDPFWARSSYGLAYIALVNTTPARIPFVP